MPARRQLRIICQTSIDPLMAVDDDRRFVEVNAPATRLLGTPAERAVRRRIEDFTPREHWWRMEELWADCARAGKLKGTYVIMRADGTRVNIAYRATRGFGTGLHLIAAREVAPVREGPAVLTPRECDVLQLAAEGHSTAEVAGILVLSPGTVKTHFQNIYAKLGACDRGSAVAEGLRRRFIQ